eukprot:g19402.t1
MVLSTRNSATEDPGAVSGPQVCTVPKTVVPTKKGIELTKKVVEGPDGSLSKEESGSGIEEPGREKGETLIAATSNNSGPDGLTVGLIGACIAALGLVGAGYYFLGDSKKQKNKRSISVKTPDEEVPMVDATDAAPEPAVPQPQLLLPGGPVAYNMQMAQMTPIPQPLGKDWLYLATTATVQPLADLLES